MARVRMTPDDEILKLLADWAPEVTSLLHRAGYFSMGPIEKEDIARKIGIDPGSIMYKQVLRASTEKNKAVWDIVLNEYSLREFKAGARLVAKQLNIPFSQYDWNDLAQGFFKDHGLFFVKNMSHTDLDLLRDRIQYDFNLNPKAFAKKYADSYSCSPARLERIKRTETHASAQGGGWNFAKEADCRYKQWLCTPRNRWPRPSHRANWYQVRALGEPFDSGEVYPGQVNCRCWVLYFIDKDHLKWGAKKPN